MLDHWLKFTLVVWKPFVIDAVTNVFVVGNWFVPMLDHWLKFTLVVWKPFVIDAVTNVFVVGN